MKALIKNNFKLINNRFTFLFFILQLVQLIYFFQNSRYQYDDSYIAYRYAANLSLGNGLVFNVGETVPTNSASSLSYVTILALIGLINISIIPTASIIISIICHIATSGIIIGKSNPSNPVYFARLLIGFLYFFNPWILYWVFSGMETTFFSLILIVFLIKISSKDLISRSDSHKYILIPFVILLNIATRWEGAITVTLLLLIMSIKHIIKNSALKNLFIFYSMIAASSISSILIFYKIYYNDIFPNSIIFKRHVNYYEITNIEAIRGLKEFISTPSALLLVLISVTILLIFLYKFIHKSNNTNYTLSYFGEFYISISIMLIILIFSAHSDFYRYYIVLLPLLAICTVYFISNSNSKVHLNKVTMALIIFSILMINLLVFRIGIDSVIQNTSKYLYLQEQRAIAGKFLEENLDKNATVIASDIGAIAFFNLKNQYFDASGLTNSQLMRKVTNDSGYRKQIIEFEPNFLVDTTNSSNITGTEYIFDNLNKYYIVNLKNEFNCKFKEVFDKKLIKKFPDSLSTKDLHISLWSIELKSDYKIRCSA
jgi:hypothetical protein